MNNYHEFSEKIKDKYLSVCKTKLKDRYGDYKYNFQIITYPGHEDKSLSERTQLLSHGKIPFGKLKGLPINDISEEDAEFYTTTRAFQLDTDIRRAFLKSKYKHLVKLDEYYLQNKSFWLNTTTPRQYQISIYLRRSTRCFIQV